MKPKIAVVFSAIAAMVMTLLLSSPPVYADTGAAPGAYNCIAYEPQPANGPGTQYASWAYDQEYLFAKGTWCVNDYANDARIVWQGNGDLCLWDTVKSGGNPRWCSNTTNTTSNMWLKFQGDGKMAIYKGTSSPTTVMWASPYMSTPNCKIFKGNFEQSGGLFRWVNKWQAALRVGPGGTYTCQPGNSFYVFASFGQY